MATSGTNDRSRRESGWTLSVWATLRVCAWWAALVSVGLGGGLANWNGTGKAHRDRASVAGGRSFGFVFDFGFDFGSGLGLGFDFVSGFDFGPSLARADDIRLAVPRVNAPLTIEAEYGSQWREGTRDVYLIGGRCRLQQDETTLQTRHAVIWIEERGDFGEREVSATVYCEGDVELRAPGARWTDTTRTHRFFSQSLPIVRLADHRRQSSVDSPIYRRALQQLQPAEPGVIQRTQFQYDTPAENVPAVPAPRGGRRFRIFKRGDSPIQVESFPTGRGDEQVTLITQGVNLVIEGVEISGVDGAGALDVQTDRLAIWTTGRLDLRGEATADQRQPVELYLEGNIVFRQGPRTIYADRMYYDVNRQQGVVLDAELFAPASEFAGVIRVKADVLRQAARDQFYARNAFMTSSLMGKPNYRLESREVSFVDRTFPLYERFSGEPVIDADTGQQAFESERLATGRHNRLYIGDVPILYWPILSTDLQDPDFYLRRIRVKNDRINGVSILSDWDLAEILGVRSLSSGSDFNLSLDYLTERGPGAGVTYRYAGDRLGPLEGPLYGFGDSWLLYDEGRDVLGVDRRDLVPETTLRGYSFGRFRQQLENDWQLTGEWGYISDRNFMEMFFETQWDEFKDLETEFEVKRIAENRSLSVHGAMRINNFFMQTEWLPRADHFWIGQSLLGDRLTWSEHTQLGYGRLRTATPPQNAQELAKFTLLPGEADASGIRFVTTHELDAPFSLGPFKIVPYALGQFAYWGEDLTNQDVDRFYVQGGVRASIPFWSVNPEVESSLLNVHGLAHKMVFDIDASYAQANESLTRLALYDNLDDDAIEQFRRRFTFNTFGGAVPPQFDERFYALRSGLASSVTSPSAEIADDLQAVRMGLRQRWQTKRGQPGARRIIDWIVLDTEAVFFPRPGRDNFGESFGLLSYDFRWHAGDRLTFLSEGALDLFDQGQQIFTVGMYLTRPPRGAVHLGFRWLEGPINSEVLTLSYNYQLSPKWISSAGASVDLGPNGNIGQTLSLTRIGESFLVTMAFNADTSKNNIGVSLGIQPRFLPKARFGATSAGSVPIAGANGLE